MMSSRGFIAVVEWVDALSPEDLDAALRSLSLRSSGTVGEKRYRLIRYQLRHQAQANLEWNDREDDTSEEGGDLRLAYRDEATNSDLPQTSQPLFEWPPSVNSRAEQITQAPTTVTSTGIWPAYTLAGQQTARTSTTGAYGSRSAFDFSSFAPEFSVLRGFPAVTSATAPTTTGSNFPPITGNFSFIGHQSLLNTTREMPTTTERLRTTAYSGPAAGTQPYQAVFSRPSATLPAHFPSIPRQEPQSVSAPTFPFAGPLPAASFASSTLAPLPQVDDRPPQRASPPVVHAGEIVRKWNLSFDGKRDHSAEEFLLRVGECRQGTRLTETDLLDAMPVLLSGVALQWFRLERPHWSTWQNFVKAFRRRFGGVNFQLRVREEVRRRTQGPEEAVADYLVGLRHIMSYVTPPYSLEEQLDFAYANLHPKYQEKIERDLITSLEQLEAKGEQLEATRLLSRGYRPPPAPKDSLFPEHAYTGTGPSAVAAASEPQKANSSRPNKQRNKKANKQKASSNLSNADDLIGISTPQSTSKTSPVAATGNSAPQAPTGGSEPSAPRATSSPSDKGKEGAPRERKPPRCFWCQAPGKTTRTCENEACLERRRLQGNRSGDRRYGSTSSPQNNDPQPNQ